MPGLYQLCFQPSGRIERIIGSRGNYYEFPDGSRLDVHSTPIWCSHCRDFALGEKIATVEQLTKEERDLGDPSSDFYKLTVGVNADILGPDNPMVEEMRQETMATLARRRQWRLQRVAPPKCIFCGATGVVLLPYDEPVSNPDGTGGTVTLTVVGMCSTDFNEWFFTPEGDRIPRDTKPTYWKDPPGLTEKLGPVSEWIKRRAGGRKS